MELIANLPVWALALFTFSLRVVDVSIGTVRTLSIVEGKVRLAELVALARTHDPDFVYSVDRAGGWAHSRAAVAAPTGWRAFWKKK